MPVNGLCRLPGWRTPVVAWSTSLMTTEKFSRRTVLTGTAAGVAAAGVGAVLAACGTDHAQPPAGSPSPAGPVTVPVSKVPVGGAAIVGDVVVSQPTAGDFVAFSAVCTHEQCLVSRVRGETVICPCHQSTFSTKDGSVISGPARRPLDLLKVQVSGSDLTIS
jgi:Rieske Fe-S protein